jgi:hypothetical protein
MLGDYRERHLLPSRVAMPAGAALHLSSERYRPLDHSVIAIGDEL